MVFLSSDGASVNSGSEPGLFRLFQENYVWNLFIWCFNHRLELAIKDVLKYFLEPVKTSWRHLYYLYTKSSNRYGKLKSFYKDLRYQFGMYGGGVKPVKSDGTRWVDQKVCAMGRVVKNSVCMFSS